MVWRTLDDVNFSWDEVRLVKIPPLIHYLQISPTEKKYVWLGLAEKRANNQILGTPLAEKFNFEFWLSSLSGTQ